MHVGVHVIFPFKTCKIHVNYNKCSETKVTSQVGLLVYFNDQSNYYRIITSCYY